MGKMPSERLKTASTGFKQNNSPYTHTHMSVIIPMLRDQKKGPSERKKERQSLYGRKDYRRKVDWYKREHIWCCECLKDGIYTPGTELHHIQSPFQGDLTKEQQLRLLYDQNNWKLLCDFHHRLQHHSASQTEIDEYNKKVKKVYDGLV